MTRIIDTSTEILPSDVVGFPEWIKPGLSVKTGRDPLGLQTITVDRIMPQLLPGILALSQRARYFSFYPFLLAEYQAHKLYPTNNALSTFIKAQEYEYGLAVQLWALPLIKCACLLGQRCCCCDRFSSMR